MVTTMAQTSGGAVLPDHDAGDLAARTFADRYPQAAGSVLWCVDCAAPLAAEQLDWWQQCPTCRDWWAQNPPPVREHTDGR